MRRLITIERIPGPFVSLYAKASELSIKRYYEQIAEAVVSSLTSGAVLDLGTGPGYLPVEIVKKTSLISVTGIDLSKKLIELARLNAQDAGVDKRLRFEVGNSAELSFADESFEMIISTGMLHMVKHPEKVFKEIHRVLKPGGKAWIFDPARVSTQNHMKDWKASLGPVEKILYGLFVLFRAINPPHIYAREKIVSMITAAGFSRYSVSRQGIELKIVLEK